MMSLITSYEPVPVHILSHNQRLLPTSDHTPCIRRARARQVQSHLESVEESWWRSSGDQDDLE